MFDPNFLLADCPYSPWRVIAICKCLMSGTPRSIKLVPINGPWSPKVGGPSIPHERRFLYTGGFFFHGSDVDRLTNQSQLNLGGVPFQWSGSPQISPTFHTGTSAPGFSDPEASSGAGTSCQRCPSCWRLRRRRLRLRDCDCDVRPAPKTGCWVFVFGGP